MLNLKITEIRKRTRVQDIVQFVLKQKWKWAGHVSVSDNTVTKGVLRGALTQKSMLRLRVAMARARYLHHRRHKSYRKLLFDAERLT